MGAPAHSGRRTMTDRTPGGTCGRRTTPSQTSSEPLRSQRALKLALMRICPSARRRATAAVPQKAAAARGGRGFRDGPAAVIKRPLPHGCANDVASSQTYGATVPKSPAAYAVVAWVLLRLVK